MLPMPPDDPMQALESQGMAPAPALPAQGGEQAPFFGSLASLDQTMGVGGTDPMGAGGFAESFGGVFGGWPEAQADGPPVILEGEDLDKFKMRFRSFLENGISAMTTIHNKSKRNRHAYRMTARKPEYVGQPNLTTPMTKNKTDGVIANMRDSVEMRPITNVSPEGIGRAAQEAGEVSHLVQAILERELNLSGSREVITHQSTHETGVVGNLGILMVPTTHESGETFIKMEAIPLEDIVVDDPSALNVDGIALAYRKRYRMYELAEMAEAGYIDQAAFERLSAFTSDRDSKTISEEAAKFTPEEVTQFPDNDMGQRTVYVGYMRYRQIGEMRASLFQCMWHRSANEMLMIRKEPYGRAFDGPNFDLARIGVGDGLFGVGIPERLAALQEFTDNAFNSHIALNNLAANPPGYVREGSALDGWLARNARFGVRGGTMIRSRDMDQPDLKLFEFPNNGLNIRDIDIANQMGSQATFTEEAIGAPTPGRRTLGQYQGETMKGTIRLRKDLGDFASDWARILQKYWAMVVAYKIIPAGVIEVEQGGKLVAAQEIPADEVKKVITNVLTPMLGNGFIAQEDWEEVELEIQDMLTEGRIPSVRRSDLTISLAGTRVIADQLSEIEMEREFLGLALTPGIMDLAEGDQRINYILRSYGRKLGLKDMDKRLPAEPTQNMEPGQRNSLLTPFAETERTRSAT